MKQMLIIKASEEIVEAEITNISSQIELYGIESTVCKIDSLECLVDPMYSGITYDYIYLAAHACDTSFGSSDSGPIHIEWLDFAAMICDSGCTKPGAIFLHSCCRGGLNQVAYRMYSCCETIEFICGPRSNVRSVDLITAFNLYLYYIEIKRVDPVRAAEKVMAATDIRLVCFDKLETTMDFAFTNQKSLLKREIESAFNGITKLRITDK